MKKLDTLCDEGLSLEPISPLSASDQAKLRAELHMKTNDGRWVTGFEANVLAWEHTQYKAIVRLLRIPPLNWAGELGYRIWLVIYRQMQKRQNAKKVNAP